MKEYFFSRGVNPVLIENPIYFSKVSSSIESLLRNIVPQRNPNFFSLTNEEQIAELSRYLETFVEISNGNILFTNNNARQDVPTAYQFIYAVSSDGKLNIQNSISNVLTLPPNEHNMTNTFLPDRTTTNSIYDENGIEIERREAFGGRGNVESDYSRAISQVGFSTNNVSILPSDNSEVVVTKRNRDLGSAEIEYGYKTMSVKLDGNPIDTLNVSTEVSYLKSEMAHPKNDILKAGSGVGLLNYINSHPELNFNVNSMDAAEKVEYYSWINAAIEEVYDPTVREAMKNQAIQNGISNDVRSR